MSGKNIIFDYKKINKSNFYKNKLSKFDSEPVYGYEDKYIKTKKKCMEIK